MDRRFYRAGCWAKGQHFAGWCRPLGLLNLLGVFLLFGWPIGPAHAVPFAFITNEFSSTVSIIDTATTTMVATVPMGVGPRGVAVHPAGTFVYVANGGGNTVSVIDITTNTVVATVPVGDSPIAFGLFIGPATGTPIPFAAFDPKVILLRNTHGNDHFTAKGSFTLGDASDGIHPEADAVVFSLNDRQVHNTRRGGRFRNTWAEA